MQNFYDPKAVEAKWQKKWNEENAYKTDLKNAKDPFYSLVMFPYPSGDKLHVGHWYNYAPADSYARFMRLKGHTVFSPMGFDAFGLPAENYAIKTGVHPAESTAKNVKTMIEQLSRIGCMYDWEKMVTTTDPTYYKWTQWLFLQMYKHDLAYRKEAKVNYCPSCQTVLANEQAQDGTCERCGSQVIQKPLTQWFWKITKYADQLIEGLDDLDWPEKTKIMQRNWIGKSIGAEIEFSIDGSDEKITVFTTRPDTLFGVTYVVLAPEHPLVAKVTPADHKGVVDAYLKQVEKKTDLERTELNKDKTGVHTGAYALHPVTGKRVPIWIADYVLASYGTGAVMAVPAHDERDFAFAKTYELPFVQVVEGAPIETEAFTGEGTAINSDFLDRLSTADAKKRMIAWLEGEEKGRARTTYRLRDWLLSRQRYWGAPIPIVYDPEGKAHPVPEEHLPWILPTDVEFRPTGKSPLALSAEFIERTEKIFGKGWRPEVDTMDTFVCSSFYYLRYLAEGDPKHVVNPTIEKNWMPVGMYIGGPEHACMHLIYARFVYMALKDCGFVHGSEPFKKLVHQGLITNQGAKMSKSKGNVVSPDSFVEKHGSDVFRMYLMFMGPFTEGGDWNDTGIKGVDRFVQRLWKMFTISFQDQPQTEAKNQSTKIDQSDTKEVIAALHGTIQKVTQSLERLNFNTAISAMMELLNLLEKQEALSPETGKTLAVLLAPLAPHLAEELWELSRGKGLVIDQKWPTFDPALLVSDTLVIAIQVNGKLRGQITVSADASKDEVLAAAKQEDNVRKYVEGQEVKKEIYVPGKLVSFVI